VLLAQQHHVRPRPPLALAHCSPLPIARSCYRLPLPFFALATIACQHLLLLSTIATAIAIAHRPSLSPYLIDTSRGSHSHSTACLLLWTYIRSDVDKFYSNKGPFTLVGGKHIQDARKGISRTIHRERLCSQPLSVTHEWAGLSS